MHPASAKGKAREDAHWQLGWWELYPLVDGPRRPVAWSKSSIIYTAHATQPLVIAHHFPSSRQFPLPLPHPVLDSLHSFAPPSIITVSPTDEWLFAFIPSREGDGVGCLWQKGNQIDSWTAKEYWKFPQGAGVVTAEWLVTERPWVVGETGGPYRLPSRGPILHMNSPTLLLVTQTHFLHVCALPPTYTPMKIARTPLLQASNCSQGAQPPPQPNQPQSADSTPAKDTPVTDYEDVPPSGTAGRRICVHAAIGFAYGESAFCVAMRSKFFPAHSSHISPQSTGFNMDLDLQLGLGQQTASTSSTSSDAANGDPSSGDWEMWGEDSMVDLSLVHCDFNGTTMALNTRPLPSILRPGSQMTDLRFFAVPPDPAPPSPTITRDPRRPVKDGGILEKGALYLAASFLAFDDYSSLPKSEVSLYYMTSSAQGKLDHSTIARFECTRTFEQGALAFLTPGPSKATILAGLLHTAGNISRQGAKTNVLVGHISVLKLPDLANDTRWEDSQLASLADNIGREVPTGVVLSPNHILLCSISPSSSILGARTSVHALPRRQTTPSQTPPSRTELSRTLVQAICSRQSPSDLIRVLTESSASMDTITDTLYSAASILEANPVGPGEMWLNEMLGAATEVYLARAKTSTVEAEADALTEQWKTAHDICSVGALGTAFEDCRDDDATYDLDAVWQLIGQTSWLIALIERILKQCIFVAEGNPSPEPWQLDADDADPLSFAQASALLHLIHPYALRNLRAAMAHVKSFREQVNKASPTTENAQLAKDALVDVVDSSGVDISALLTLLDDFEKNLSQIPVDELRRGLVSCSITAALRPFARQAIDKVLASQIIKRTRLFIKPADLTDGIAKMALADQPWEKDSDVVSKGMLLRRPRGVNIVCVRCGGKSETSVDWRISSSVSLLWRAWETLWSSRCVCGGAWARSNTM